MDAPRLKEILKPLIGGQASARWGVAPNYRSDLQLLKRRVAAARLGMSWPRRTVRPLRAEDLQ